MDLNIHIKKKGHIGLKQGPNSVPYESNTYIGISKIHGNGLMAGRDLEPGQSIGIAHIDGQPTSKIGAYHNHSDQPNAESILRNGIRTLRPLRKIQKGEEITIDYRRQPELEQPRSFQNGGDVPPYYTTDPNDPRLQAYQDSLAIYNFGKLREKKAEQNTPYPDIEEWEDLHKPVDAFGRIKPEVTGWTDTHTLPGLSKNVSLHRYGLWDRPRQEVRLGTQRTDPDPKRSVVDYLSAKGEDASFDNRAVLAEEAGITDYAGTKDQNVQLLEWLNTRDQMYTEPTVEPVTTPIAMPEVLPSSYTQEGLQTDVEYTPTITGYDREGKPIYEDVGERQVKRQLGGEGDPADPRSGPGIYAGLTKDEQRAVYEGMPFAGEKEWFFGKPEDIEYVPEFESPLSAAIQSSALYATDPQTEEEAIKAIVDRRYSNPLADEDAYDLLHYKYNMPHEVAYPAVMYKNPEYGGVRKLQQWLQANRPEYKKQAGGTATPKAPTKTREQREYERLLEQYRTEGFPQQGVSTEQLDELQTHMDQVQKQREFNELVMQSRRDAFGLDPNDSSMDAIVNATMSGQGPLAFTSNPATLTEGIDLLLGRPIRKGVASLAPNMPFRSSGIDHDIMAPYSGSDFLTTLGASPQTAQDWGSTVELFSDPTTYLGTGALARGFGKGLIKGARKFAPKWQTAVRIEPTDFNPARVTSNLPPEMQKLTGRWYGPAHEADFYIKTLKSADPSAQVRVTQTRLPEFLLNRYRGINMPLPARQMSAGPGIYGDYGVAGKSLGIPGGHEGFFRKLKSDATLQMHPELFNPNEIVFPGWYSNLLRKRPTLIADKDTASEYVANLLQKQQTPFLGINRQYLPFKSGGLIKAQEGIAIPRAPAKTREEIEQQRAEQPMGYDLRAPVPLTNVITHEGKPFLTTGDIPAGTPAIADLPADTIGPTVKDFYTRPESHEEKMLRLRKEAGLDPTDTTKDHLLEIKEDPVQALSPLKALGFMAEATNWAYGQPIRKGLASVYSPATPIDWSMNVPYSGSQFLQDFGVPSEQADKIGWLAELGTDPTMVMGAGQLGAGAVRGIKNLVPQAYKYNPWSFQPNPEAFYRMIGTGGYDDAMRSGVIRPPQQTKWLNQRTGEYELIDFPMFDEAYYAKGFPYDKNYARSLGRNPESAYQGPYMVEVSGKPELFEARVPESGTRVHYTPKHIPASLPEAKFYEEHWLRGYREVPKVFQ